MNHYKGSNIKNVILSIGLIFVLGFIVYSNSLSSKFVWDDNLLVVQNIHIKDWNNIIKVFTKNPYVGTVGGYSSYRPLEVMTHMVDYSLWGLKPCGHHLTNILLHILAAMILFLFINVVFQDHLLAIFASLLFVVHPIHTEVVDYISGRSDSLALIFMLSSFIIYIKMLSKDNLKLCILFIITYSASILSRETSLILPFLIFLYHFIFQKRVKIYMILSLLVPGILYVFLRLVIIKHIVPTNHLPSTILERIPGVFVAIATYLRLLFTPFDLHYEYGQKVFNFLNPQAILGILLFLLLIIYAFRHRTNKQLISFSILWFFIALFPVSNIYPNIAYMLEHWLYTPSIGFFLILASILVFLYRKASWKIFSISLLAALIGFYSFLTIRQAEHWKDDISCYQWNLKFAPNSPRFLNNLATAYDLSGRSEEAITLYKRSIQEDSNNMLAYSNLAFLYQKKGDYKNALILYKKTVQIDPGFSDAYANWGTLLIKERAFKEALKMFEIVLLINPNYAAAYVDLGLIYTETHDWGKAINSFKKAITINPDLYVIYYYLGNVYQKDGHYMEAINMYNKSLRMNMNFTDAYVKLGDIYRAMGRKEDAVALYNTALIIMPKNAALYNNLGVLEYKDFRNFEEAVVFFKKALVIAPENASINYNLSMVYAALKNYNKALLYLDKSVALRYHPDPDFLRSLESYRKTINSGI